MFRGCAASIFRYEVCDDGDVSTASLSTQRGSWGTIIHATTILVYNHLTIWYNKPENHDFYP
jgi:hypothetical protein